jgi:hypothetical protein
MMRIDELVEAVSALQRSDLEAWIREAPEQWLWFNTRFEGAPAKEVAAPSGAPVPNSFAAYPASAILFALHCTGWH